MSKMAATLDVVRAYVLVPLVMLPTILVLGIGAILGTLIKWFIWGPINLWYENRNIDARQSNLRFITYAFKWMED